jgi:hypothetical protein
MLSPVNIPFEAQADPQNHRGCGAACLSMVYKSFGKEVPQADIWPQIAKPNRFGSVSSTTHLMALHAIGQGLSAVAMQVRHPLQVLRLCREGGIRAILNHRRQRGSEVGHFSVFVDIDDRDVILHDPFFGEARRLPHAELLELWLPESPESEVLGNVILGIAADPASIPACEFCHTAMPARVECPQCAQAVSLSPAALLGCIQDGCIARMWNYVACPSCDFVWSFNAAATAEPPPNPQPEPASAIPKPQSLDKIFAELDKFCARLLAIPGAAQHADLNAQLDVLKNGKERLRLAQLEELVLYKAKADKLAAFERESRKKQEELRKKIEEINQPLPPLDGIALGHALLRNLGFE